MPLVMTTVLLAANSYYIYSNSLVGGRGGKVGMTYVLD